MEISGKRERFKIESSGKVHISRDDQQEISYIYSVRI